MTYTPLAHFNSSSSDAVYTVATDGTHLSCNCPGWTRQTHFFDCPQVVRGDACTCRASALRRGAEDRTTRTCKHLRALGRLGVDPVAYTSTRRTASEVTARQTAVQLRGQARDTARMRRVAAIRAASAASTEVAAAGRSVRAIRIREED
jgi:hypothetical protein